MFQIFEEVKMTTNKYGSTRQVLIKISRKFDPITGNSKTRPGKKFAKCKLYDVKRNPEEWITKLELIRGDI